MERLLFGARARRRARLKRTVLWLSAVSLVGIGLGVPGTDVGLRLLDSIGRSEATVASSSGAVQTSRVTESTVRFRRQVVEGRPKPDPKPSPSPSAAPRSPEAGSVTEIIYAAAARHGVSGDYLMSIARCESSLDPGAYNPAGYHGLFQFDFQTWAAFGSGEIYDPVAQADAAAELIAAGQSHRWPNCG